MHNSLMYKLHDGDNGWKWNPFFYAYCNRIRNAETGKLTATGHWAGYPYSSADGNFPTKDQIESVTGQEYTRCPEVGDFHYIKINDDRISELCEPFNLGHKEVFFLKCLLAKIICQIFDDIPRTLL